jgi:ankyrin repeat protein
VNQLKCGPARDAEKSIQVPSIDEIRRIPMPYVGPVDASAGSESTPDSASAIRHVVQGGEASRMPDFLSHADAKELVRLCRAGRLYEVEAWIRAGRPLTVPREVRTTPLDVALGTGFHSLIELLLRHEESQEVKNGVLSHAVFLHNPAVVELAIANGADVTSASFLDVLLTGHRALVLYFLERGADAITDHPFARAFQQLRAKTTIGSYLDCRRIRPDLAEGLQRQADMALRQFAQEGNLKWVSLLIWAGADPRSPGPTVDDAEDSEWSTTALHEACGSGDVNVLKQLRPVQSDDLRGMLERAAEHANSGALEHLLALGANPNDKPDGGSGALDACLRILGFEEFDRVEHGDFAIYEESPQKPSSGRSAIRVLLRHGAVWTPDPSKLDATRRILYKLEPDLLVELMAQLRAREAGEGTLRILLRVRQLRQFLAFCERRLARPTDACKTAQTSKPTPQETPRRRLTHDDRWRVFDAMWSKPMAKVARRYRMPAVDLRQACKELEIPLPPRGYWSKKKAGEPVPRRPRLTPIKRPFR